MYLLNNIHDRKYGTAFPSIQDVIFDLSEEQLRNVINREPWTAAKPGQIACLVSSTRRLRAIYRIDGIRTERVKDSDGLPSQLMIGQLAAVIRDPPELEQVIRTFGLEGPRFRLGSFANGVNLVDIGTALDSLKVSRVPGGTDATVLAL